MTKKKLLCLLLLLLAATVGAAGYLWQRGDDGKEPGGTLVRCEWDRMKAI